MLVTVYKILHHEEHWQDLHAHLFARLPPPVLFSLKHMAGHVFTHEI